MKRQLPFAQKLLPVEPNKKQEIKGVSPSLQMKTFWSSLRFLVTRSFMMSALTKRVEMLILEKGAEMCY